MSDMSAWIQRVMCGTLTVALEAADMSLATRLAGMSLAGISLAVTGLADLCAAVMSLAGISLADLYSAGMSLDGMMVRSSTPAIRSFLLRFHSQEIRPQLCCAAALKMARRGRPCAARR